MKAAEKRVAFIASKKVGKATLRNRAKRRLRSIFRDLKFLENGVYILVARTGIENAEFEKIKKDINFAFRKLGAIQGK